jgi:hypothetical protein
MRNSFAVKRERLFYYNFHNLCFFFHCIYNIILRCSFLLGSSYFDHVLDVLLSYDISSTWCFTLIYGLLITLLWRPLSYGCVHRTGRHVWPCLGHVAGWGVTKILWISCVNIIYRYGIPQYIITNNGKSFYNSLMDKLCEKFKFKQHKSSMCYALANGLAKTFNKTLCNLLQKWWLNQKEIGIIREALWRYRTTYHTVKLSGTCWYMVWRQSFY